MTEDTDKQSTSDSKSVSFQWRDEVSQFTEDLICQTKHSLLLYTEDIEPAIFNTQSIIDAVTAMATNNRHSYFWILVRNSKKAVQSGNRLIELGRHLSPQVQFRKPSQHMKLSDGTFLISDDAGFISRPRADRYDGFGNMNAPGEAAELKEYFMDLWKYAEPDSELRRLYL